MYAKSSLCGTHCAASLITLLCKNNTERFINLNWFWQLFPSRKKICKLYSRPHSYIHKPSYHREGHTLAEQIYLEWHQFLKMLSFLSTLNNMSAWEWMIWGKQGGWGDAGEWTMDPEEGQYDPSQWCTLHNTRDNICSEKCYLIKISRTASY